MLPDAAKDELESLANLSIPIYLYKYRNPSLQGEGIMAHLMLSYWMAPGDIRLNQGKAK